LAESLIAGHEQLAAAVRRYPNGVETVRQEAEAKARSMRTPAGGSYYFLGAPRDLPYVERLMQASRDGGFAPPLEDALERYREDSAPEHPNRSARECWPSTCAFRQILYNAGKRLGPAAAEYLGRIPDADLRLFAQIELAAALAEMPELLGVRRG
jgi:hypothetical protein